MGLAIVTGSHGLIGSETVRYFHQQGLDVVGIDNDCRKLFFGAEASTHAQGELLKNQLKRYQAKNLDIRDT